MSRQIIAGLVLLLFQVQAAMAAPSYQNNDFKTNTKPVSTIWAEIPFFEGGDLGQYQETMSQSRDDVRKMLWQELMNDLHKLADKGVAVEFMLEPMANILMMFDQVHDIHKAKDIFKIDFSLENQFKAALDSYFQKYDVRDNLRKIQIGHGTKTDLLESYIRQISKERPLGTKISRSELDIKKTLEIYDEVDYVSYGTFSSLGHGIFQVTYHLEGHKNGVNRSFISRGRLTEALDDLAKQVFDYFQRNTYPDWENPQPGLKWLPMPKSERKPLYAFAEAKMYCEARGYRLPYTRELFLAATGTEYKDGGIGELQNKVPYAVNDHRETTENYFYTPGNEIYTGGPTQVDQNQLGKFWCVKGAIQHQTWYVESLWSIFRDWRTKDKNVIRAVETLRYEAGDFGVTDYFFWGPKLEMLYRYESPGEARHYLQEKKILLPMRD